VEKLCERTVQIRVDVNCEAKQGQALPIQAWRDALGSRRLRLPEFLECLHIKVVRVSPPRTRRF